MVSGCFCLMGPSFVGTRSIVIHPLGILVSLPCNSLARPSEVDSCHAVMLWGGGDLLGCPQNENPTAWSREVSFSRRHMKCHLFLGTAGGDGYCTKSNRKTVR